MTPPLDPAPRGTGAYGLSRPTLADAEAAIVRAHLSSAPVLWASLLERAGLSGREAEPSALDRLLDVMDASADPVVALSARALRIRTATYDRLAAAVARAGAS